MYNQVRNQIGSRYRLGAPAGIFMIAWATEKPMIPPDQDNFEIGLAAQIQNC
jgi:hypothetical protein